MPRPNAAGLARDVELLDAIAAAPGTLGVTDLARATGRSVTQVSRALTTLIGAGLVSRDPDSRGHRPGPRLFAIAAASAHAALVAAARAPLRALALDTQESVYLCAMQGDVVLTLHAEVGVSGFRGSGWEGRVVAASSTSAGRVLLSDWSDDAIRRLVAVERSRATTAAMVGDAAGFGVAHPSASAVLAAVRRARADGFAVVDEEFEAGLVGASAPVHDATGTVIAAVNVVGPKRRLGGSLPRAGVLTRAAAAEVSAALGWQ